MRGRSKSIVQKIAADVPTYDEDVLNLGLETISSQRRSRSIEPKLAPKNVQHEPNSHSTPSTQNILTIQSPLTESLATLSDSIKALTVSDDEKVKHIDGNKNGDLGQLAEDLEENEGSTNKAQRIDNVQNEAVNHGDPSRGMEDSLATLVDPSILSPLTSSDSQALWSAYTSTFNYNCLLPESSIDAISSLSTNQFQNFQTTCSTNKANLLNLISSTNSLLESTDLLLAKYNQISRETSEFDATSSKLLALETSYSSKLAQIEGYLQHFENLEAITKNLSRSGFNLIQRHQYFSEQILVQLDSSLEFFSQHNNFRDIETYTSRFRQCMTRGLTLIKNYLVLELKDIDEKVHKDEENFNLLVYNEFLNYIKFNGDKFNSLVQEIVSRVSNHHEYLGLLKDVLANYFRIRRNLVTKYLENDKSIKGGEDKPTGSSSSLNVAGDDSNFVQVFQDQISYYKTVVEKEFNLFKQLFVHGAVPNYVEREFYLFLAELLEPLYDSLRYLILREINISKLCQVTTLLQKYYEFDEFTDDFSRRSSVNFDVLTINYGDLFQNILHDVQTRLIFRIQLYVDDKLMRYKPEPEDLMFDVRVGGRRRKNSEKNGGANTEKSETSEESSRRASKDTVNVKEDGVSGDKAATNADVDVTKFSVVTSLPSSLDIDYPDNLFPNVYPPLAKELTLLSNIYELINSVVFDDLAHYIVHACIVLLKGPFYSLAQTHLGLIDTQLLYLLNLILLKSQVTNFDIQFTRNDFSIDFTSGLTSGFSAVWSLIRRGEFTFNDGFLELARKSVPKVVNDMIDANLEIELELENVVREFVEEGGRKICEPLNETIIDKSAENTASLATITTFKDNLLIMIPNYHQQIKLFIKDDQIVNFLLESLINVMLVTYEKYVASLEVHGEGDVMEVDALKVFLEDLVRN